MKYSRSKSRNRGRSSTQSNRITSKNRRRPSTQSNRITSKNQRPPSRSNRNNSKRSRNNTKNSSKNRKFRYNLEKPTPNSWRSKPKQVSILRRSPPKRSSSDLFNLGASSLNLSQSHFLRPSTINLPIFQLLSESTSISPRKPPVESPLPIKRPTRFYGANIQRGLPPSKYLPESNEMKLILNILEMLDEPLDDLRIDSLASNRKSEAYRLMSALDKEEHKIGDPITLTWGSNIWPYKIVAIDGWCIHIHSTVYPNDHNQIVPSYGNDTWQLKGVHWPFKIWFKPIEEVNEIVHAKMNRLNGLSDADLNKKCREDWDAYEMTQADAFWINRISINFSPEYLEFKSDNQTWVDYYHQLKQMRESWI